MLSQRPAKAPHPLHTGERVRTPTQKHQVPVAQLQQIPDGDGRPRLIVRHHIAALLPVVHAQVHAGSALQQVGVLGLALPGQGRDQHAVDLPGQKVLDGSKLPSLLLEGVAQQHPVPVFRCRLLNGSGDAREVGVGQSLAGLVRLGRGFGKLRPDKAAQNAVDEGDHFLGLIPLGDLHRLVDGGGVGHVSQLGAGGPDPFLGLCADLRAVVQSPGHSGRADPGQRCHVLNGRPPHPVLPPICANVSNSTFKIPFRQGNCQVSSSVLPCFCGFLIYFLQYLPERHSGIMLL